MGLVVYRVAVHGVDLGRVALDDVRPTDLHRRGEESILYREGLSQQHKPPYLLVVGLLTERLIDMLLDDPLRLLALC